jgi:carbamoyltransferase
MRSAMDWLVIGNHLFNKKEQPKWHEKENWQDTYELD